MTEDEQIALWVDKKTSHALVEKIKPKKPKQSTLKTTEGAQWDSSEFDEESKCLHKGGWDAKDDPENEELSIVYCIQCEHSVRVKRSKPLYENNEKIGGGS